MHIGYLGIVILMVISPLPPEVFMPLAGFMVAQGELNFLSVLLAAVIGFLISVLPWYFVGKHLGKDGLDRRLKQHLWLPISSKNLEKANRWFQRYGRQAVFFSLLIPGIRNLISIPAGISGMRWTSFLFYSTLSATFWLAILTFAGYWLGGRYYLVHQYLGPAYNLLIAVFVIAAIVWGVKYYLRQKAKSSSGM
jgi:membrane protein DedA with SNARE-associated domain